MFIDINILTQLRSKDREREREREREKRGEGEGGKERVDRFITANLHSLPHCPA